MTFVRGNSSQVKDNEFSDQAQTIINNVQLLNMNQSRIHRLAVQNIARGFVDTFTDQSGVDLTVTSASYNDSQSCFTSIVGSTGLTKAIQINTASDIELSDPSGLSITDQGLCLTKTVVADGSLNQRTDYASVSMTSNSSPSPLIISASSEHSSPNCPAWRVFDQNEAHSTDPQECWIASSIASEQNPQWLQIDFGVGTGVVINKYRLLSRNSSDSTYVSAPSDFELSGSNDSENWVALDSRTNLPELPSNAWSDYLTFTNGAGYRYYRFTIKKSWGEGLTSLSQLKLVEASHTVSNTTQLAIIPNIVTSDWSRIGSIIPETLIPDSTLILYALSFNMDTDSKSWKIWDGAEYKDICRLDSGAWLYRDSFGSWTEASTNSRFSSLENAFGISSNQMYEQLSELTYADFEPVFSPGRLSIAIAMVSDQNEGTPSLCSISITYDEAGNGLDLVSRSYNTTGAFDSVCAAMLVSKADHGLKAYVDVGGETPEWSELASLNLVARVSDLVDCYSSTLESIGTAPGPVRLRVVSSGTAVEIRGWTINWA